VEARTAVAVEISEVAESLDLAELATALEALEEVVTEVLVKVERVPMSLAGLKVPKSSSRSTISSRRLASPVSLRTHRS